MSNAVKTNETEDNLNIPNMIITIKNVCMNNYRY